jgi:type I restriction enzyme S subunit
MHPLPQQFCRAPAKTSPQGAILMSVRAPVGRLNVADQKYGIGRGLCAVVPYESQLFVDFARYALDAAMHGLTVASTGSTFDSVSIGDVGSQPSLLPPHAEQSAIVRFLDYADRRIRHYIRAKQKLIKLLDEQRKSVIQHIVLRGLDPNVRLKSSGIEWLGDVPEQWEVKWAKWYFREIDERSEAGTEELLSVSHLTGVTPRSEKSITMFMAESYVGHKICREGDLVVNTMWAWMGALGISRQTGIVSPSYAAYRPISQSEFVADFVDLLLRLKPYVEEYRRRSTGIHTSRLRLYPDKFLRIPLLRPELSEQHEIVRAVQGTTGHLTTAINGAARQIDLIREYRTRLVQDVVTGKYDVRAVAATLPDEPDELEKLDETEALSEADAEEAEPDLDATLAEAAS